MTIALAKKRKTAASAVNDSELPKKKSPLAYQPQNYYAPPTAMTKEQLSEWRKEQRRERNRQSAAASRNKTKERIEELEGEVAHWRRLYDDLQAKMSGMERQIEILTKLRPPASAAPVVGAAKQAVTPPGSSPNSPPLSPRLSQVPSSSFPNVVGSQPKDAQIPDLSTSSSKPTLFDTFPHTTVTPPISPTLLFAKEAADFELPPHSHLFPPLVSSLRDHAPMETGGLGQFHATTKSSKSHLIHPISRQAVKITGVTSEPSNVKTGPKLLPVSRSGPFGGRMSGKSSIAPGPAPVEAKVRTGGANGYSRFPAQQKPGNVEGLNGGTRAGNGEFVPTAEDADFLDILVETLDGEDFDPDLLL